MRANENNAEIEAAAEFIWAELFEGRDAFPSAEIYDALSGVLEEGALDAFLEAACEIGVSGPSASSSVEAAMSADSRREFGIYLTPRRLANVVAAPALHLDAGEAALDLSCGAGALLLAAVRHTPALRALGVELKPALAAVAAARLVSLRRSQGLSCEDRIWVGDGLDAEAGPSEWLGRVGLALGNPPYIREKGNRERFAQLRARHRHLESFWAGRMDLQYLFFHRSLDYLKQSGWLGFLTSSYWLRATRARNLRDDLLERARPRVMVEVRRAGVFDDAPGHHTLLTFAQRNSGAERAWTRTVDEATELSHEEVANAVGGEPPGDAWASVELANFTPTSWLPFVDASTIDWGERWRELGIPVCELLADRQGFVSGADQVHAWNEKRLSDPPERGTPIYLFVDGAPKTLGRAHGTVVRPVIRGSRVVRNEVIVEPPGDAYVLYVDEEVDAEQERWLSRHLGPFREILEVRREVKTGTMPWYRLHWPRSRQEQRGPKLVVPRRARHPAFALDLSGSSVSSDCTYLLAPGDVEDPIRYLVVAMVLLNRPETERYLREFGKTKGDMLEFYSDPIQRLPLPVRRRDGQLLIRSDALGAERASQVRANVDAVLASLR